LFVGIDEGLGVIAIDADQVAQRFGAQVRGQRARCAGHRDAQQVDVLVGGQGAGLVAGEHFQVEAEQGHHAATHAALVVDPQVHDLGAANQVQRLLQVVQGFRAVGQVDPLVADHGDLGIDRLLAGRIEVEQAVMGAGAPAMAAHGLALGFGQHGAVRPGQQGDTRLPTDIAGDLEVAILAARAADHVLPRRHAAVVGEGQRLAIVALGAAADIHQRDIVAGAVQAEAQRLGSDDPVGVGLAFDVKAADLAAIELHAHPGIVGVDHAARQAQQQRNYR